MPTVSEFIEALCGNPEDLARIQAHKVLDAIGYVGGYRNVVFDDAVTMAVIHQGLGGWAKICSETTTENSKWFEKDFVKLYTSFSSQGIRHYEPLIGRGVGSTKFIGDKNKIDAILAIGSMEKQHQIDDMVKLSQFIPKEVAHANCQ